MRSTRNQPFCWQEKTINRLIRKEFTNNGERIKMLLLYTTITEIDSDFNQTDIKFYTKTIAKYSGLSKDFIPRGLKSLEKLKIILIKEERINGKYKGKKITFTPTKVEEMPQKTVIGETVIGETIIGESDTSEDIILKEDIIEKEDITFFSSPPAISQTEDLEVEEADQKKYLHKDKVNIIDIFRQAGNISIPYGGKVIYSQIEQMFDAYGVQLTTDLAKFAVLVGGKPYAPSITTPTQLFHNAKKLIDFYNKEKEMQTTKKKMISEEALEAYKRMIATDN
jgi:hypothetical protein